MHLAVIFDVLIPARFNDRAIIEREPVDGVLEVLFFHQHALERLGVEAEGGAALESLLVCIQIDVLEFLVGEMRRHVRCLRNR